MSFYGKQTNHPLLPKATPSCIDTRALSLPYFANEDWFPPIGKCQRLTQGVITPSASCLMNTAASSCAARRFDRTATYRRCGRSKGYTRCEQRTAPQHTLAERCLPGPVNAPTVVIPDTGLLNVHTPGGRESAVAAERRATSHLNAKSARCVVESSCPFGDDRAQRTLSDQEWVCKRCSGRGHGYWECLQRKRERSSQAYCYLCNEAGHHNTECANSEVRPHTSPRLEGILQPPPFRIASAKFVISEDMSLLSAPKNTPRKARHATGVARRVTYCRNA